MSKDKAPPADGAGLPPAEQPGGDTLKDASDEAVRFMEEGDEPGHAGRGDGG